MFDVRSDMLFDLINHSVPLGQNFQKIYLEIFSSMKYLIIMV